MKVLIGGGTGFIGRAITRTLKDSGWDVWNISRSRGGANTISWVAKGDVEKNGIPECDAVINLSGENAFTPFRRWDDQYRNVVIQSRMNTTRLLADSIAASSRPPKAWVATSAEGYYPVSRDQEFTEYSEVDCSNLKDDFFRQLCVQWEDSGRLPGDCPTRHSIIRVGLVLGRDGGILNQLWYQYKMGMGGPVGGGDYHFCWIHIQDMARMYQFAIECDNVSGVLNGTAPGCVLQREFAQALGAAMYRPALLPTPGLVMKLLLGSERGEYVLKGKQVLPQRVQDLGFKFNYPDITSCLTDLVK